jgi:hypothetical protein
LPAIGSMRQGNLVYNEAAGAFFMAYWHCPSWGPTTVPAGSIWRMDYQATSVIPRGHGAPPSSGSRATRIMAREGAVRPGAASAGHFDLHGRRLPSDGRRANGLVFVRSGQR